MSTTDEIERLYHAFAPKKKPATISACPCCHDESEVCSLLKTPLRQITPSQLSAYAGAVFLTAGSERDFRYLLPRMLEISNCERHWWPDREVLLAKLRMADWMSWHDSELDILHAFFEAAFDEALLSGGDAHWEVDSWICGLALAGVDVRPYLRKLEAPAARDVLLGYFELNAAALPKGELGNAFWNGHNAAAAPVIEWFESAPVQSVVWKHYGAA